MTFVGIDPSLTGTAIAIIDPDAGTATTRRLPTKGTKADTLEDRARRLEKIASWVFNVLAAEGGNIALVAIEGPSLGQMRQGGEHVRAGLWWAIVRGVLCGAPVIEIPPATLKKYVAGKGNAGKDEVVLAVAKRYPSGVDGVIPFPGETNDDADAFVLAAIAARLSGHPIEPTLPATHVTALDKLRSLR